MEHFVYIYNLLKSGVMPQDWKLANVIPIFIKGYKKVVSNYHFIGLILVDKKW